MRGILMSSLLKQAAVVGGVGALLVTYGCGAAQTGTALHAQEATAAPAATPIVVGCEPNQRTLVRPTVVNGAAMSQVECVSTGQPAGYAPAAYTQELTTAPVAAAPTYRSSAPRLVQRAPTPEFEDARVIQSASYPVARARPVRARQVVYDDDRPVRTIRRSTGRSVQKSAIIIGSTAGIGAGVGAAVGGKKGAGIGALLGGGGAALWDQITRHKQ